MLLIGTGQMAREYAKVLKYLQIDFNTVGNTKQSSDEFYEWCYEYGIKTRVYANKQIIKDEFAIVAVPILELYEMTNKLIFIGCKNILIEKPGALYTIQMRGIKYLSDSHGADVRIGYNRRFYQSVQMAKKIIEEDGLCWIKFCFGEDMKAVEESDHLQVIKDKWIISNSHCIDTAFFLSGLPINIQVFSINPFRGQGSTSKGLFNYDTNWEKDKRWHIEFRTNKYDYELNPIEMLLHDKEPIIKTKSEFKPGLLEMVNSFVGDKKDLTNPAQQLRLLQICNQIGGYRD
jgi:predicted dehydrogenase